MHFMFPFTEHKSSRSLKQKKAYKILRKSSVSRAEMKGKHCSNTCHRQSLLKLSESGCVTAVGVHLLKAVHNRSHRIWEICETLSQNEQILWAKPLSPLSSRCL